MYTSHLFYWFTIVYLHVGYSLVRSMWKESSCNIFPWHPKFLAGTLHVHTHTFSTCADRQIKEMVRTQRQKKVWDARLRESQRERAEAVKEACKEMVPFQHALQYGHCRIN